MLCYVKYQIMLRRMIILFIVSYEFEEFTQLHTLVIICIHLKSQNSISSIRSSPSDEIRRDKIIHHALGNAPPYEPREAVRLNLI